MKYIIFAVPSEPDLYEQSTVHFFGASKQAALAMYKEVVDRYFCIIEPFEGYLYFCCFDSNLLFMSSLPKKAEDFTTDHISTLMDNFSLATCCHSLKVNDQNENTIYSCSRCGTDMSYLHKTAFGEYLCEECWDTYMKSVGSPAEYVIGLGTGAYSIEYFSDKDKELIVNVWNAIKFTLGLSDEEITAIENKAIEAGLTELNT